VNEINLEKLKKENGAMIDLAMQLKPTDDENLTWNKIVYDNGYYLGEFNKENQRHGRGVYVWGEGTYFVGYWVVGIKDIYGKYFQKNGFMFYDGAFKNGLKDGKGSQFYNDKSKYVGQFVSDKRQGTGRFTWADGSAWEGPFVDGQFHGVGMYQCPGEEPFEAEYENGKLKEE